MDKNVLKRIMQTRNLMENDLNLDIFQIDLNGGNNRRKSKLDCMESNKY